MGFPEGDSREIVAGNTLIAEAIQSQNYVAGTTGWAIKADGTVDLAGGTFRGSVVVTSPDGSLVQIVPGNGGKVEFGPKTVSGVTVTANGSESSSTSAYAGGHYAYTALNAPQITDSAGSGSASTVSLLTKPTDGTPFPGWASSAAGLFEIGPDCQIDRGLRVASTSTFVGAIADGSGIPYKQCVNGIQTMSFTSLTSSTVAVSFGVTFASAPHVTTNINDGSGATAQWHSRAISITTTGFTLFVFSTASSTWTNIPVSWAATAR